MTSAPIRDPLPVVHSTVIEIVLTDRLLKEEVNR
jgi:hypothetical protein